MDPFSPVLVHCSSSTIFFFLFLSRSSLVEQFIQFFFRVVHSVGERRSRVRDARAGAAHVAAAMGAQGTTTVEYQSRGTGGRTRRKLEFTARVVDRKSVV